MVFHWSPQKKIKSLQLGTHQPHPSQKQILVGSPLSSACLETCMNPFDSPAALQLAAKGREGGETSAAMHIFLAVSLAFSISLSSLGFPYL